MKRKYLTKRIGSCYVLINFTLFLLLTMIGCFPKYLNKASHEMSHYEGVIYWNNGEKFFIFEEKLALSYDGRTVPTHFAYFITRINSNNKKITAIMDIHPNYGAIVVKIKGLIDKNKRTSKEGMFVSGHIVIENVISAKFLSDSQFEKIMSSQSVNNK